MTARIADIHPLTSAQAGLLVSSLTEPEPGLYIVQMRFGLSGRLERRRLEFAWETLAVRHAVLRTAISWESTSRPVNVVMGDATMPVTWLDLSGLDDVARAEAVDRFLVEDRRRGFDLQHAPLSRVTILAFGDDEWEMVWTHHHVILDGWSTARLIDELWQAYTGRELSGAPPPFKGFATALASDAERNRTRNDAYWRARAADGSSLITVDRLRDDPTAGTWLDDEHRVPGEKLDRWRDAARRHGTTLSTLYHASWALTLRASGLGVDELVFGTVVDTRGTGGDDVIGLCVASVPLRISFSQRPIGDWLRDIAVDRATSQEHAGINLAEHRRWTGDRAAPFRYLLAIEGYPHDALIGAHTYDALTVRYLGVRESTEYALTAGVPAGSPSLKLTFDTRRIAVADAAKLLDQWATALDTLSASRSDEALTDVLEVLPSPTRWRTLPERIGELAQQDPDRPAFRSASTCLTLRELERTSQRVARRLRAEGCRPGDHVGVLVDDSVLVAVAILAILTTGGIVVPLDPRHPAPYRAAVIASAGVRRVLTPQPDARPDWNTISVHAVSDILMGEETGLNHAAHDRRAGLSFLLYDGGSALRPVATAHDHDSVVGMAAAAATVVSLAAGDDWLVTRPAAGAAAPWEMWVAPLNGGCTVIAPGVQHRTSELALLAAHESLAVISVTRSEAQDLVDVVDAERRQLISVTRAGRDITLWSATGEHLGRLDDTSSRPAPTEATAVDGVPVDAGHLEMLLIGQPGITSCAVRQGPDGRLEAIVGTATQHTPLRDLRRRLRSSLPEALVPRLTLAQTIAADATVNARQAEVERNVRRLWAEVLGLQDVSIDTPFFDLGGHSLMLFTLLRGLKMDGWADIDMTDLLTHPTVRSLSRWLCRPDPLPANVPREEPRRRRDALAARRERGRR